MVLGCSCANHHRAAARAARRRRQAAAAAGGGAGGSSAAARRQCNMLPLTSLQGLVGEAGDLATRNELLQLARSSRGPGHRTRAQLETLSRCVVGMQRWIGCTQLHRFACPPGRHCQLVMLARQHSAEPYRLPSPQVLIRWATVPQCCTEGVQSTRPPPPILCRAAHKSARQSA